MFRMWQPFNPLERPTDLGTDANQAGKLAQPERSNSEVVFWLAFSTYFRFLIDVVGKRQTGHSGPENLRHTQEFRRKLLQARTLRYPNAKRQNQTPTGDRQQDR